MNEPMYKYQFFHEHDVRDNKIKLYYFIKDKKTLEVKQINATITFEQKPLPAGEKADPFTQFDYEHGKEFLSALCKCLVEAGYTKTGQIDYENLKEHRDDLQKIVYKLLKIIISKPQQTLV